MKLFCYCKRLKEYHLSPFKHDLTVLRQYLNGLPPPLPHSKQSAGCEDKTNVKYLRRSLQFLYVDVSEPEGMGRPSFDTDEMADLDTPACAVVVPKAFPQSSTVGALEP